MKASNQFGTCFQLLLCFVSVDMNFSFSLSRSRMMMSTPDTDKDYFVSDPNQPEAYRPKATDKDYFNRAGPWDEKDLNSLLGANKACL